MEKRGILKVEDGELLINKKECYKLKEFRLLIQRDKGSKGDFDGKKKYKAFKELFYVYLVADPLSLFRDMSIEDRKERAKKEAELEEDWKEDVLVKEAIIRYGEMLMLTGTEYAYFNASRGIYSIGKDLDIFNKANDRLRKRIEKIEVEIEDGDLTPDELESKELDLDRLTERLSKNTMEIIKTSGSLTPAYKSLSDLYEKMREEQDDNNEKLYGGGTLGRREE